MRPDHRTAPLTINVIVMNIIKTEKNLLRLKRLRQGPRLAIRRLLRSFEPLDKPPGTKPSTPEK